MKKALLYVSLLILVIDIQAQTSYTWNGSSSSNWNISSNWTPNGVPGSADNVTIVTGSNICSISANQTINNFTINSGTLDLGGGTLSVNGTTASFTNGTIQNGTITVAGATTTTFGSGSVTMNCITNISSATVAIRNTTFQNTLNITKTGAGNDVSYGGNIFNGTTTITNAGSGYLLLANNSGDQFNGSVTFNNTGSNNIYVAHNSTGNVFNGVTTFNNSPSTNNLIYVGWYSIGTIFNNNIIVSSTNGQGVQFCGGNTTSTATLSSGYSISVGGSGFSSGTLSLRQFTQNGNAPINITATGTAQVNLGPSSNFGGQLAVTAPNIYPWNSVFNSAVTLTKTDGTNSNATSGGNTYNSTFTANYISTNGTGYWSFGYGNPDIYNGDVYSNNNSLDRIIFGHNSANNQFNGNIYVSQIGSSVGTALTWNAGSTCVMTAGKTIIIGTSGFSVGYFYIQGLTQNGATAMNLTTTGNSSICVGAASANNPTVIGGDLNITAPDVYFRGGTFNKTVTITKTGGGNDNNSSYQNIFNSTITINQQSSTGYFMLGYNSNDQFNDNITVTSTGAAGIYLGWGTGTATLAAGKTISIGGAGFSAGFLVLGGFTQLGSAPINLSFTGSSYLQVYKTNGGVCNFGGAFTVTANDIYIQGGVFNGAASFTKTGGTNNHNNQIQNIFNSTVTINQQSNTGYFMLGYNTDDQFNDNITVSSTGSGGIYLGYNAGASTPTLAAGKAILIGAGGFSAGFLTLGGFTQLGSTPINLTLTGTAYLQLCLNNFVPCNFGGSFTVTAPDIYVRGATFNGAANFTKTGGTNNHNNQIQNIFNSTCTINQQSNTGYFMLGYNSNDQFNDDIILTSTGSGGIYLGWTSGTGTPTLAAGKTISVGPAGFNTGFLSLNTFTQLGSAPMNLNFTGTNTYISFSRNSVIGGNLTLTSPDMYFNGCVFNGTVTGTKTGSGSDASAGGNTYNGICNFTNSGGGYLMFGNGIADTWNADVYFVNNGSERILPAWNSTNNQFNGNIIVSNTGSGVGIQFCGSATSNATLAATKNIQIGAAGFNTGYLILNRFTQLGNAASNLTLTGSTTYIQVGPSSAIGGDFTVVSPRILLNGATYSGNVNLTKTGFTGEWSSGGNIFNGITTINQLGSGYFGFANGSPDVYNGDLYLNNNSTERIILGNSSVNNQFNGNIIVTQIGSSVGIALGWNSGTTMTMAAGKTISIGAAGFNVGYLQIERFTQLGNTAMNLPLTGTSSLTFGPSAAIGGDVTSTSASLYFNGCIFSGTVNSTKNGSTSDASSGNNIFNGTATMTNAGAGYLMFGNGNADQFNAAAIFNNTGTSNIYVAYNSSNNIFGGATTFTNIPSANTGIYVSSYSTGTVFNDNIVVNSTNGQGVQFCTGNTTATVSLAAGKTIAVGASGFSAGTLLLKQFSQIGSTSQSLTLTGTANLTFGPTSAFGGNITTVSPALYFNGCIFSGTVNSTKNGSTNDGSSGNNTFNGAFTVTNTGSGYFAMGITYPDTWQSTATFNNYSTGQHMYIAHNSSGNIFNGDVTFNNQPGSTNLWIYSNYYGANTQFNGNINIVNVNGAGIYFGASSGSAALASGNTIIIGASGFNYGGLIFRNFVQNGSGTAQNITTSGSSYIQFSSGTIFNGPLTSSSPGILFNGATFNGTVNSTKTGSTNDQSAGGNIFNGASTFTNTGTGYLMMTNTSADAYNGDISFVKSNTGLIYPNYNNSSTYMGNLNVSSNTAITFGSGNGTAVFGGSANQNMNATGGTPAPVFTRLIISNSGAGVTLNTTSINVSGSLTLTTGLLNTTTSNILTMLNGSSVAAGNALSTSYVNGPMRYQKSSGGTSTLNFPIGNGADCRPVILTINHSNGTLYTYQAQLFNANANMLGYTLPPTVDKVSGIHYYTINRTDASGTSQPTAGLSGNQTIQIFFGSNDLITNGAALTIVKNTYNHLTSWIDIGGAGGPANTGGNLTGSIYSTSTPSAFNSFSTFALADETFGGNVLPTKLIYFNAQLVNDDSVKLSWATATETNNSYFTVEKSSDGIHFTSFEKVNSQALNGNSTDVLNYSIVDRNPFYGITYYRLKQTDLDNNDTYYNIVAVQLNKTQLLTVFPNPASGFVYVKGLGVNESNLKVEWYDLAGRLVKQEGAAVQNGFVQLTTPYVNGVYYLRFITSDGIVHEQKIIIKR
ncbi:MAG TPA: T9SS type A sorting domain-containing protein [Puia sp.]|nr:T9SS type A sorting domain-containing protein [Puia sp.]